MALARRHTADCARDGVHEFLLTSAPLNTPGGIGSTANALAVLTRATTGDFVGTVNVGGEGTLLLSQVIRRLGRLQVPLPSPALGSLGRFTRRFGYVDYSPEQMRFLNFGRVVDTTVLREERYVTGFFRRLFPGPLQRALEATPVARDVAIGHIQCVLQRA